MIYTYRCPECGDVDADFAPGRAAKSIEHCGRRALRVLGNASISIYATPNKAGFARVQDVDQTEQRKSRDLPAYKRMRKQGLQPKSTRGAAQLEDKVGDQFSIDYDRALQHGPRSKVEDTVATVTSLTP
jgi:hypothetical protein